MSELSDKEKARRRAKLEAAVTPQGSSGYARQRLGYRKPITAPSWVYWPANRIVAQWQVVSLSLGLDPDSLEQRGDYITPESFPDADTQGEFKKRIDLLGALTEKVCAPLSQFVGILGMVSMPPELSALNLPTPGPATIETAAGDSPIVCDGGTATDNVVSPWPSKATSASPATAKEIALAFPVPWRKHWPERLRKAANRTAYGWLAETALHRGSRKPGDCNTYSPSAVAIALVLKKEMSRAACDAAIRTHFPKWLDEWNSKSDYLKI